MIVNPGLWRGVGEYIAIEQIELAIECSVRRCQCSHLALSGGIDSSLLLSFMTRIYPEVDTYTIAISDDHPDLVSAKLMSNYYDNVRHHIYVPTQRDIDNNKRDDDFMGDDAVRLFYGFVKRSAVAIVAGDGIDELMCGYYAHQKDPIEEIYYDFMRRLQEEQLQPLDRNSGEVGVHLPYLDNDLIDLLSKVPLTRKVSLECRKKLMVEMAQRAHIPDDIITRRKYGFCDALFVK